MRHPWDDVAVQEGPSGVAVQEQQHGPAFLIDVMDLVALDLHKTALERVELFIQPLRAIAVSFMAVV